MEKITYQPLIQHLKDEEAYYEHLLVECEMKQGSVSGDLISIWMVNMIQPLIVQLSKDDIEVTGKLCKAFFKELLSLIQNGNLTELAFSYYKSWLMTVHFAHVFKENPHKILLAFSSAIHSIHRYQPKGLDKWLETMEPLLPACRSLDDVLNVGRIASWMSGMAHLHRSVLQGYEVLSQELKQQIQANYKGDRSFEISIKNPGAYQEVTPITSFGGFIGLSSGLFSKPPKVALLSGSILATDGENTCALFADEFGKVVLENISINAAFILNAVSDGKDSLKLKKLKKECKDLSSFVISKEMIVFTRSSSFNVFIQG